MVLLKTVSVVIKKDAVYSMSAVAVLGEGAGKCFFDKRNSAPTLVTKLANTISIGQE